jgi:hypothetical protein
MNPKCPSRFVGGQVHALFGWIYLVDLSLAFLNRILEN